MNFFRNLLENTIQPLSDAPEQILKNVGHMQLRITHDKQDVINTFDIEANKFLPGANYQILVQSPDQKGPLDKDGKPTNILRTSIFHKITDENSVHIFWLLPQFVSDDFFIYHLHFIKSRPLISRQHFLVQQ